VRATVEIRAAREDDLDAIHRLEVASFPVPWQRQFFASELVGSGRLCLVALIDGALVGYVFAMTIVDEMHINKIAVAADYRRRGIALELMDHCFTHARKQRIRLLSLEVRRSNSGAQDFYRRLEFEPAYVRPRYYPDGEAAVVMTRAL
jgi:ribosomal-protein-alanine N-acetyltransferase